jgi:endonuclease/exonuclease/phosphatase family metal-dependent hydrolase
MASLRFLTFNIHGGKGRDGRRDLGRIQALMECLNVDIGVFQEIETRPLYGGTPQDVALLAGAHRPHRFVAASMHQGDGWYGNLVVSRYPFEYGLIHNLETPPVFEPRNALDVLVVTPLGKIRVVGTHLSLSPIQRWAEAHKLIERIVSVKVQEKNPVLLMGDINEWQWPSRLLRFLNKRMFPVPCAATFPSWLPLFRLDRVWHDTPGLKVAAHRLNGLGIDMMSDHLPVLVEVVL